MPITLLDRIVQLSLEEDALRDQHVLMHLLRRHVPSQLQMKHVCGKRINAEFNNVRTYLGNQIINV